MKLQLRHRGGVTVLEPHGKITIGQGDVLLRRAVDEALASGARKILIDLDKVTSVDSSGIAEMVAADSAVKRQGGALKLVHLPPKIYDVLGITQLISVFEVFETEEEAIASFSEETPTPVLA